MCFNRDLLLIGAGYWGKNLARNFYQFGALHTVCDSETKTLEALTKEYPGIMSAVRFEHALDNAAITKVAIAAPAALHYPLTKAALNAGKDVFVEKPLCLNVEQGQELVELARQNKRVLMVGHLLQYHPCVRRLQTLVGEGELGKLHYITSNRLNLGKFRSEENALWSFAPHDISVILSLAGNQVPDQVRCTGDAYLHKGVADTTLTTLRFANGIRAHVYVSWLNPFKEQKLTVVGSNGMLVFDDTLPWTEKLMFYRQHLTWTNGQTPTPTNKKGEPINVPQAEPLHEECSHFLLCCRERRAARTDAEEGLRVLSVLHAAQTSLDKDGKAILLSSRNISTNESRPSQADYFAHPTAVIDEGAVIGEATKIWHFTHISGGADIGKRCIFGQNTFVANRVVIGNNVKVQNNVSIYSGAIIEDDVFLGPSCVLTNVTNPRSQINRHKLFEKTIIRRGATIGANATVLCGLTLGSYCFIAAGSVVTKDVPGYALMMGAPACQVGWMSRHGQRLKKVPRRPNALF